MASNNTSNVISNCVLCYSDHNSSLQFFTREEIYFVLNKLLEVPVEHFQEAFSQLGNVQQVLSELSLGLEICDLCNAGIEQARAIYEQLVVASRQFRVLQKRLVESVKNASGIRTNCRESRSLLDDKCRCYVIANNYEENGPFLVEDLKTKVEELITSEVARGELLEPKDEEESRDSTSVLDEESFGNVDDDDQGPCLDWNTQEEEADIITDDPAVENYEDSKTKRISNEMGENDCVKNKPIDPDEADITGGDPLMEAHDDSNTEEDGTNKGESNNGDEAEPEDKSSSNNVEKLEFKCTRCQMSCPTQRGLTIHMSRRHRMYIFKRKWKAPKAQRPKVPDDKPKRPTVTPKQHKFKCPEEDCDKSFQRSCQLKIHVSRHNKSPMFKCNTCEEEFYTKLALVKHQRKRHPELVVPSSSETSCSESFLCNVCSRVCKTSNGLIQHQRLTHNIEPPKDRACPEEGCGKRFKLLGRLKDHLCRDHGQAPTHKCTYCGEAFQSWKMKWRHEQKIHQDGLTKRHFMCELCGKGFPCTEYLSTHKAQSHSTTAKGGTKKPKTELKSRVICELCGKSLKNNASLNSHYKVVHEKSNLKFACHLCEKRFLIRQHLNGHLYHHHHVGPEEYRRKKPTGEVFQCPVTGCRKRFYKDKARLEKHTKKIHGEDGGKPARFSCRFCGREFHLKFKLQHHEMIHENKETRPFKCDICEKGFPTPAHLKFHKKFTHKIQMEDQRHPWVKAREESGQEGNRESTTHFAL